MSNEWRYLCAWARWVLANNAGAIQRICGLTYYGSIPTILMEVPDFGEIIGPVVYNQEGRPPASIGPQIQKFMDELALSNPPIHRALIGRHLRKLNGRMVRSEVKIAMHLYGRKRSQAHAKLVIDCNRGYQLLAKWLQENTTQNRQSVSLNPKIPPLDKLPDNTYKLLPESLRVCGDRL